MNPQLAIDLVTASSLRLVVAAALCGVLMRHWTVLSPFIRRRVWTCVMLQSLLVFPMVIPIAILPADPVGGSNDWASMERVDGAEQRAASPNAKEIGSVRSADGTPVDPAFGLRASLVQLDRSHLFWFWIVGVAVLAASTLMGCIGMRVRLSRAVVARATWQDELVVVCEAICPRLSVRLYTLDACGPLVAKYRGGYRIVVPASLWSQLTTDQRRAVLLHELAHLQHGDLTRAFLVRGLAILHWFNPIAWWVVSHCEDACELACDAAVRKRGERHAVALAHALVQVAGLQSASRHPKRGRLSNWSPLSVAGMAAQSQSSVAKRVHRLVETSVPGESLMRSKWLSLLAIVVLASGLLRLELTAKEVEKPTREQAIFLDWLADLRSELGPSEDPLQQRLVNALDEPAGQRMLGKAFGEKLSEQTDPEALLESVLARLFDRTQSTPEWVSDDEELMQRFLLVGQQSGEDLARVTMACEDIAAELSGDDETTRLLRRFLLEEAGPAMLYAKELQAQMRPGTAMFEDIFGQFIEKLPEGNYRIREDARDEVAVLNGLREQALKRTSRLADAFRVWGEDLVPQDELHERAAEVTADPRFAAMFAAEPVFQHRDLSRLQPTRMMEQIDSISIDTADGLVIDPEAWDHIEEHMQQYAQIIERWGELAPALRDFQDRLDDSDAWTSGLKQWMDTDIAVVAIALTTKEAQRSPKDVILAMLGEALERTEDGWRVRSSADEQMALTEELQNAFREFRQSRRRSAPVREIAAELENSELANAITSVGGLMLFRDLMQQEQGQALVSVMNAWREDFFDTDGLSKAEDSAKLVIRQDQREIIQNWLDRMEVGPESANELNE